MATATEDSLVAQKRAEHAAAKKALMDKSPMTPKAKGLYGSSMDFAPKPALSDAARATHNAEDFGDAPVSPAPRKPTTTRLPAPTIHGEQLPGAKRDPGAMADVLARADRMLGTRTPAGPPNAMTTHLGAQPRLGERATASDPTNLFNRMLPVTPHPREMGPHPEAAHPEITPESYLAGKTTHDLKTTPTAKQFHEVDEQIAAKEDRGGTTDPVLAHRHQDAADHLTALAKIKANDEARYAQQREMWRNGWLGPDNVAKIQAAEAANAADERQHRERMTATSSQGDATMWGNLATLYEKEYGAKVAGEMATAEMERRKRGGAAAPGGIRAATQTTDARSLGLTAIARNPGDPHAAYKELVTSGKMTPAEAEQFVRENHKNGARFNPAAREAFEKMAPPGMDAQVQPLTSWVWRHLPNFLLPQEVADASKGIVQP